ncbi:Hypothetical predicted protein [Podarcis lilfordi]|uniref:Secreted protein n=1 Tax=Podarcis lilfordi TaxID=74358 RepID=A0AA35KTC8_9SAUR|nr:Hypothetical predicted protein [Podarcis lilfordi]
MLEALKVCLLTSNILSLTYGARPQVNSYNIKLNGIQSGSNQKIPHPEGKKKQKINSTDRDATSGGLLHNLLLVNMPKKII